MEKRPNPVLLLLVIFACFSAGLFNVWHRQRNVQPSPVQSTQQASDLTPAGDATASDQPQQTLLILGVDNLQSQQPALVAIWYATFRLPGEGIFLFGLPTDSPSAGAEGVPLYDLFLWSADQGVDPTFLEGLAQYVTPSPDVILVLDEVAFATLVDYVGGVTLEGAELDGSQVVGVLRLLADQPQASLATQRGVLLALISKAHLLGSSPDATHLIDLIPSHAYCSAPPQQVVAMLLPLLPLEPTSVFLHTP
ncbi:MAG: hypothetical protein PVF70_10070 [Anaerolineales bacterium]|jgi:hypothetical protein